MMIPIIEVMIALIETNASNKFGIAERPYGRRKLKPSQVPRNVFRESAQAFATDPQPRSVARRILASGFDRSYPTDDHCSATSRSRNDATGASFRHQSVSVAFSPSKSSDGDQNTGLFN
jgi:Bacterial protein of unknown function (DUF924)